MLSYVYYSKTHRRHKVKVTHKKINKSTIRSSETSGQRYNYLVTETILAAVWILPSPTESGAQTVILFVAVEYEIP
jgi:hypothetical protein